MSLLLSRANSSFNPRKCSVAPFLWVNAKTGVTVSGGNATGWADLSGNGYNMAPITSNPAYSATAINGIYPGITFDGSTNDMCRIGLGGSTRTTFSGWMICKPIAYTVFHALWYAPSSGSWTLASNDLYFEDGGNNLSLDFWQQNVAAKAGTSTSSFQNNFAYEVAWTYDTTTLKIYINGSQAGSQAVSSGKIGDRIALGGLKPGASGFNWHGVIAEFVMFGGVLSAADRANLHRYGQYNWCPIWLQNTGSFYFNGSTALDAGTGAWNYDYNNSFSISAWVCPDASPSTKLSILGCEQGSGAFRGMDFLIEGDGRISLYMSNTWSTNVLYAYSTSALTLNGLNWSHIAVTYDGTTHNAAGTKFYINGVLAGSTTSTNDTLSATIIDNSLHTYLGNAWGTSYQVGKMQNVAVFGSVLSSGDISTIYNGGIPYDITGYSNLAHWWYCGFGGDTLTSVPDRVGSWNMTTSGTGIFSPSVPLPLGG